MRKPTEVKERLAEQRRLYASLLRLGDEHPSVTAERHKAMAIIRTLEWVHESDGVTVGKRS